MNYTESNTNEMFGNVASFHSHSLELLMRDAITQKKNKLVISEDYAFFKFDTDEEYKKSKSEIEPRKLPGITFNDKMKSIKINAKEFYRFLLTMLEGIYNSARLEMQLNEDKLEAERRIKLILSSFLYVYSKTIKTGDNLSKFASTYRQTATRNFHTLKACFGDKFINDLVVDEFVLELPMEDVQAKFNEKNKKNGDYIATIDFNEKLVILKHIISKEDFEKYKFKYISAIVTDEMLLNKLIEDKFITADEIVQTLGYENIYTLVKDGRAYLIKYLDKENLLKAYNEGFANVRDLKSLECNDFVSEDGSLIIKKDDFIEIIRKNKNKFKKSTLQSVVWNLFENGTLSSDEINILINDGVINVENIIKTYEEERARKIKAEITPYSISDVKLAQIVTPDCILSLLSNVNSTIVTNNFIGNDLKMVYKAASLDLETMVIQATEKLNKSNSKNKVSYIDLYEKGLVGLDALSAGKVSAQDVISSYKCSGDEQTIVDGYNCGLIKSDAIIDIFEDDSFEDKICELISNKGLNASILNEYYNPEEILRMFAESKITPEALAKNKSLYTYEYIQRLYNNMDISLDILGDLVQVGIVSEEQAKKIRKSYDIKSEFKKLVKEGRVIGLDDVEEERAAAGNRPKRDSVGIDDSIFSPSDKGDRIGLAAREDLLRKLGAEAEIIPVSGDLFKGYYLYAILDYDIAILEPAGGRNLTFVMPLRMVLEQVNSANGKSIISNVKYKKELSKHENVTTLLHTFNWGVNVINAMCGLNEEFSETRPIKSKKYSKETDKIRENFWYNKYSSHNFNI